MPELDDEDGLEAGAAEALGVGGPDEGPPDDLPRCQACGAVLDDVEKMDEQALLDHARKELLKDLVRGFKRGTITHQEKAILVGLMRLNNSKVAPAKPEVPDEFLPAPGNRTALPDARQIDDTGYDETNGG